LGESILGFFGSIWEREQIRVCWANLGERVDQGLMGEFGRESRLGFDGRIWRESRLGFDGPIWKREQTRV
jgi:hypothetical protein